MKALRLVVSTFRCGMVLTGSSCLIGLWCVAGLAAGEPPETVAHLQGEMAGEVTEESVILQSRLTARSRTADGDVPGAGGVACFEISTSPDFNEFFRTNWIVADPENDFIVKTAVRGLRPGTRHYYRLRYGKDADATETGGVCTFNTLDGEAVVNEVSFVVVTGMNYALFQLMYRGEDKMLGYPGLASILRIQPDFFVSTGDSVYYDVPGRRPPPARTQAALRKKWHEQFAQPRFVELFAQVPTYWEKDDHDFRYNDCDTTGNIGPSAELGIRTFIEQVPVVPPDRPNPVTYRTHRVNKLLQIWLTEGRDYRSSNMMEDGPEKTIWGREQKAWLKKTLFESDATFKVLISPTPMVGPDDTVIPVAAKGQEDNYKRDNQTNPKGFKHEGETFFRWLGENGFLKKNFYIVCGDRHWQYHSIRHDGFEEFSCGALVDANSRLGRKPGDPKSTDPDGRIEQPYTQAKASGGFLHVTVKPGGDSTHPTAEFAFYDENGVMLYTTTKTAN